MKGNVKMKKQSNLETEKMKVYAVILEKNEEENFNGRFSCKWIIPMADEAETYEIRLTDKKGTYFVNLYFDGQEKAWTACLTK